MVAATPPYTTATSMSRAGSPSPLSQPPSPPTTHNRRPHDANRDSAENANTPLTPSPRYVGWVAEAVAPLEGFIDESVDPRDFYCDLREIAHTENGSVLAAALVPDAPIHRLKLPSPVKTRDARDIANGRRVLVAVKCLALLPGENARVERLRRECELLRGLWCEQMVGMDALYVDLVEDALWIRSELMEGRLTDMIRRIPDGLRLQEPPVMARLASDMLHALVYLQGYSIAHGDLCSENLFINGKGVLKVAGFSNAVRVTPLATDVVAPEVHDSFKFDVWCVGAIVWEMAEAPPPPFDPWPVARLPPVNKLYPAWLQDFLNECFVPAVIRPSPKELLEAIWIQRACGRPIVKRLVSSFRSIEATRPASVT
ncbi:kinase-like domain-containing protein [Mycena albidolilacea]|uniref:Kinase-like domain-containing protein n=1 Tax=Mycena albidolilacea TaxID=1033008 RepID=A0AAD7EVN7_9AGAR|nr:kinase-like domain-containing protein [Mycena albidolilacea]